MHRRGTHRETQEHRPRARPTHKGPPGSVDARLAARGLPLASPQTFSARSAPRKIARERPQNARTTARERKDPRRTKLGAR